MNKQYIQLAKGQETQALEPKQSKARIRSGFTLIEMIGVLAVIAILAVVIAPRVFDAIRSSRINSALVSVGTFKTATAEFVAKYGTLPTTNNKSRFDDLLIEAKLMDERFHAKIGAQADIYATSGANWSRSGSGAWTASGGNNQENLSRIICKEYAGGSPANASGSNFRLDGSSNLPSGSRIISAVFIDVAVAEARELSVKIDGEELSNDGNGGDAQGKVAYASPSNGITDVFVYLTHQ